MAASVAVIICAIGIVWRLTAHQAPTQKRQAEIVLPTEPLSFGDSPRAGSASASLGLIQFSDFECPYCGRFARDVWPQLRESYVKDGRLQASFRHFPLGRIHPLARGAAIGAACAAQQGKFWEMHDSLFAKPSALARESVVSRASGLGLIPGEFALCLNSPQAAALVDEDVAAGRKLGLKGTPAFFVGSVLPDGRLQVKKILRGAQPLSNFQAALESLMPKPVR